MPCKICEDSSSLEHREVVTIVVDNSWDSTIRRKFCEPRFLLHVLADVDALPDVVLAIRSLQFLQNNGSFVSIGGSPGKKLDPRFGNEASRSLRRRHRASRYCWNELSSSLVEPGQRGLQHEEGKCN